VYEPGTPQSWSLLNEFTSVTGVSPKIVLYYSGWHERFWSSFATAAHEHGATVFVKMEPATVTLASIAAGDADAYLRSYALSVAAFKYPVMISFAHEMNGNWYPWSASDTTPAQYVAAWRHVVTVFRAAGATNASWVWTVNSINDGEGNLIRWWPGASWVSWVGVDGYFLSAKANYTSVFGKTINQVRSFTRKPVLIAETSVGKLPDREQQIWGLFSGARAQHITGLIWFDVGPTAKNPRQNWRLEGDRAAVRAFKRALRG
jgi:beta-mannanase